MSDYNGLPLRRVMETLLMLPRHRHERITPHMDHAAVEVLLTIGLVDNASSCFAGSIQGVIMNEAGRFACDAYLDRFYVVDG